MKRTFYRLFAGLLIFLVLLIFSEKNFATLTAERTLGIENSPWMQIDSVGYAMRNPALWHRIDDQLFLDFDLENLSGALTLRITDSLLLALFSGSPTATSIINSGLAPTGFFDFGGSDYIEFFNTDTGGLLDSSSLNGNLGNLPVRVNQLNDPGFNSLNQENAALAMVFSQGKSSLGLQAAYGVAKVNENFFGKAEEEQGLEKSQLRLNVGLIQYNLSSLIGFWDIAMELKFLNLNNFYSGVDTLSNDRVSAVIESAGAFDAELFSRLGIELTPTNLLTGFISVQLFDYSTTARAQSNVTPLELHTADNFSRNGWILRSGFSTKININKSVAFLLGTELNYKIVTLFYDGIDYRNQLYAQQPLSGVYYYLKLPAILGFEAQLSSSLIFSLALQQNIVNIPQNDYVVETNEKYRPNPALDRFSNLESYSKIEQGRSATALTAGFSLLWQDLRLDWLAQLGLFREGPYLLSGRNENFSTSFGIRYKFKKVKSEFFDKQ